MRLCCSASTAMETHLSTAKFEAASFTPWDMLRRATRLTEIESCSIWASWNPNFCLSAAVRVDFKVREKAPPPPWYR